MTLKLDIKWLCLLFILGTLLAVFPSLLKIINNEEAFAFTGGSNTQDTLELKKWFINIQNNTGENLFQVHRIVHSIFINTLKINGIFEIWWLQGILSSTFTMAIILSICKIAFKKINIVGLMFTIIAALLMYTFAQNPLIGSFINNINLMNISLALVIFSWKAIKRPRIRSFALYAITGIAGSAFSPSAIWIFTISALPTLSFYISSEKPRATLFITSVIIALAFSVSITLYSVSQFITIFGIIIVLLLSTVTRWISRHGIKFKINNMLIKIRGFFIPVLVSILMIISLILWSTSASLNHWMNFVPKDSNLIHNTWLKYLLYSNYWIVLIIGSVLSLLIVKKTKKKTLGSYMIIFGTMTTITFYSPFTATLFKIYLMNNDTYIYFRWITVAVLSFGLAIEGINFTSKYKNKVY